MRRLLGAFLLASTLSGVSGPKEARAQWGGNLYSGANSAYGAPGLYGMSYGVPSYGVPRTYSAKKQKNGSKRKEQVREIYKRMLERVLVKFKLNNR